MKSYYTPSLALLVVGLSLVTFVPGARAADVLKNWTPPPGKSVAQAWVEKVMAARPELASLTLHGVPPGTNVNTMFASSWPDRIGNADDAGDMNVTTKGWTVLSPALHDKDRFFVLIPMKDLAGNRMGLAIIGFKKPEDNHMSDLEYYAIGLAIRDELQRMTPNIAALLEPAK